MGAHVHVLAVTCHVHVWQNDSIFYVLLRQHGVERIQNKNQQRKLNWREAQNLKGLKPVLNWVNICFAEHSSEYSSNFTSFLNLAHRRT